MEGFLVRSGLLLTTIILMMCSFFHFWGSQWFVGYQTFYFALFGFSSIWMMDSEHLLISLGLSIFNWFCVTGRLALLGYNVALVDVNTQSCVFYFGLDHVNGRCSGGGYLNFLRLLGLVIIFFQAFAIYFCWRAYKISVVRATSNLPPKVSVTDQETNLFAAGISLYQSIPEPKPEVRAVLERVFNTDGSEDH
eukprot:TRINITY_DN2637_c0_g1_i1.p1 TRINITY_DN2637_c0_g1~~TRINITY_DN2637_c0_g1_i1.p1  ORF type:complete len:193 (-),score=33.85 TRINITY_DN2637_c0_g1_i1:107-685(-)